MSAARHVTPAAQQAHHERPWGSLSRNGARCAQCARPCSHRQARLATASRLRGCRGVNKEGLSASTAAARVHRAGGLLLRQPQAGASEMG